MVQNVNDSKDAVAMSSAVRNNLLNPISVEDTYDDSKATTVSSTPTSDETRSLNSSSSSSSVTLNDQLESLTSKLASAGSSISLSSLSASFNIPSHQHFRKFIHKHEVPRKAFHMSIGFLTMWLYTRGIVLSQVTPILAGLFVFIGTWDLIRFKNPGINKLYIRLVGFLMRESEVNNFNGVIWYLLGLVIVFLLFPKDISLMSVLLLSWSDTAASTVGRAYGHLTPKIGRKSLAGSLAAFATGVFSACILYLYFIPAYNYVNKPDDIMWTKETSSLSFPVYAFLAGVVGAVSEAIDVFNIDDNFTIPVLSGIFLWGLVKFCSIA